MAKPASIHVQNEEDVRKILSEIERFRALSSAETSSYLLENLRNRRFAHLSFVPGPDGSGPLLCGPDAGHLISELARRYLSTQPEKGVLVSEDVYEEALVVELSRRFLGDSQEVDRRNVDRMFASAFRRAEASFREMTYYLPCTLLAGPPPVEFDLGPIHFVHKDQFKLLHQEEIANQRQVIATTHQNHVQDAIQKGFNPSRAATPEDSESHAEFLVSGWLEFLNRNDWVALITIPKSEKSKSRLSADLTIEAGLNILKLLLGASVGGGIRSGNQAGSWADTADLVRESDGPLKISRKRRFDGLPADWYTRLVTPDDYFLRTSGRTLSALTLPSATRPLCQRFIWAATWFGQAASEISPAAKIVKYTSVLEALLSPKRGDEIERAVTVRGAILCDGHEGKGRQHWVAQFKEIYDSRSRLVHGSISPFSPSLPKISWRASKICRWVLLRMLQNFDRLGLDNTISDDRLETEFGKIETAYPVTY